MGKKSWGGSMENNRGHCRSCGRSFCKPGVGGEHPDHNRAGLMENQYYTWQFDEHGIMKNVLTPSGPDDIFLVCGECRIPDYSHLPKKHKLRRLERIPAQGMVEFK